MKVLPKNFVFISSANNEAVEEFIKSKKTDPPPYDENGENEKLRKNFLCLNQIEALFLKKCLYLLRNYFTVIRWIVSSEV